uniref:Uncharacterized protein n=1 Tax=Rhizophora mucronata TaxID=61149 RepID=A0A2P2P391_RHIMU
MSALNCDSSLTLLYPVYDQTCNFAFL